MIPTIFNEMFSKVKTCFIYDKCNRINHYFDRIIQNMLDIWAIKKTIIQYYAPYTTKIDFYDPKHPFNEKIVPIYNFSEHKKLSLSEIYYLNYS
jgi:hypothetical protein